MAIDGKQRGNKLDKGSTEQGLQWFPSSNYSLVAKALTGARSALVDQPQASAMSVGDEDGRKRKKEGQNQIKTRELK